MAIRKSKTTLTNLRNNAYISRKMENHIYRSYKLGSFLGVQPFKWNTTLERPETVSWWGIARYHFNLGLHLANLLFVYARTWQLTQDPRVSQTKKVLSQFMSMYWTLAYTGFQLSLLLEGNEMLGYVTQTLKYLKGKFRIYQKDVFKQLSIYIGCNERNWATQASKRGEVRACELILDGYLYLSFPSILINVVIWSIMQPRNPTFFISVFLPAGHTPVIYRVASGISTAYLMTTYLAVTYIIITNGVGLLFGTLALIKDLG